MAKGESLVNTKLLTGIIVVLIILIGVLLFSGYESKEKKENINMLIPQPASYIQGEGEFILKEDTKIIIEGNNKEEITELTQISKLILDKINKSTGFNIEVIESKILEGEETYKNQCNNQENIDKANRIILSTLGGKEQQGEEGYSIEISQDNIKLVAYKPQGIFRGFQTLRQLFPSEIEKSTVVKDVKWSVPVVSIEDKPEYSYRGIMIDVARHFFSVEDIKNQIELISQYKINKLHLHLSNDQGWRLEIKKWPELTNIGSKIEVGGTEGGYYTQEEFKEIVEFAKERLYLFYE